MTSPATKQNGISIRISVLLLVAIGGLVAFAVGAVLLLSAYANFRNTSELVSEGAELFMASLDKDVHQYLNPASNITEHIAREVRKGAFDPTSKPESVAMLSGALAAAPQISAVTLFQPNAHELTVHRDSDNQLVISTEDNAARTGLHTYIGEIKAAGKKTWNPPFRLDSISFVSVASPLYADDRFAGVVVASITLEELSTLVEDLGKAHDTTGFILYGKEKLLAHAALPSLPTTALSSQQPLHNLSALKDKVIQRFQKTEPFATGHDKAFIARRTKVDDKRFIILSREISGFGKVPWVLGQYSEASHWNTQFVRLGRSIIGGLVLLAVALLAAVWLARHIAAPIRRSAQAASHIGALELDQIKPVPPSRISELNNLASSFNQMLEGLRWFETYVPKQLVRRLIQQGSQGAIESGERELTVMFTDMIGFTSQAETMSPTEIANMLNQHFSILNECIEAEGGTLDKYIGDAVMAFWGAPEEQPDHAARACRAALAMQKAFAGAGVTYKTKIAIHTGPLIVGNIGAPGRMNYTVIGDTVNTCSRIEKLAGEYRGKDAATILISAATAQSLPDGFELDAAREFSVKGREKPVTVFRLRGSHGQATPVPPRPQ